MVGRIIPRVMYVGMLEMENRLRIDRKVSSKANEVAILAKKSRTYKR